MKGAERRFRRAGVALAVGVVLGCATGAHAVNRSWNTGTGLWNVGGNWSPVGVPAAVDNALIGNTAAAANSVVNLGAPTTVASLSLTDGMRLDTQSRSFVVNGLAFVSGLNTVGPQSYRSTLIVRSVDGLAFHATDVELANSGMLLLDGSTARVDDLIEIGPMCWVQGDGMLSLWGNGARSLINDGYIDPIPSPFPFTISQFGDGLIDLDGNTGNGQVLMSSAGPDPATVERLTINGTTLADAFDGEIRLRDGAVLNMNLSDGWTLGVGGFINNPNVADGGETAILAGGPVTLAGTVAANNGDDDGKLYIEAEAVLLPSAVVNVSAGAEIRFVDDVEIDGGTFSVGSLGELNFLGPTTVSGGDFTTADPAFATWPLNFYGPTTWNGIINVDGVARQTGNAAVTGSTIVNADTFDLDGSTVTVWTLSHSLVVNAALIDSDGQEFNATMNIGGGFLGRLGVNLQDPAAHWTMAGDMNITGDGTLYVTRLAGSPMHVTGELRAVSGRSRVDSDVVFEDNCTLGFNVPTATLRMHGNTRIEALAEFDGAGNLYNAASGVMTFESGATSGGARIINDGRLRLDDGPGICAFDRFQSAANAVWEIDIGGSTAGGEHDLLIVSPGLAEVGGTIEVNVLDLGNGFEPQIGDEFLVLTANGGVSGAFTTQVASCSSGVRYQWTVLHGTNDVRLRLDAINDSYPGDLNCDCAVTFSDIDLFVEALSYPGGAGWPADCPWSNADCNGDGEVDFADIDAFVALIGS